MTLRDPFIRHAFAAALVAAFFAVMPYQAAQAQRTSLSDIDQKLDGVQDTLGPVPGASDPDIQQRLDTIEALLKSTTQKTVFVTSDTHNGNLGGLAGADAICQARADSAGLRGRYRAWLSNSTETPDSRFTKSSLPYVRTDGARIAINYDDLTDGTLEAPINRDQNGVLRFGASVWTSTNAAGARGSISTCANWGIASTSSRATGGATDRTNNQWTLVFGLLCSNSHRLYCFQQ